MKVHFLTPAYDGTVHVTMAWSLMLEIMILKDIGIDATWSFYPGCCYVDISRNMLVKEFLEGDYTDAFFIDSDVQWVPGAVAKMVQHKQDFVCGLYPYKVDELKFPAEYEIGEDRRPIVDPETGLIKGKRLPTGFMRLKRSVFEKFIEKFGDDLWVEDHKDPENVIKYQAFFDTPKIGKQKWGEDLHFCNQWLEMGGEVWIDPDITFWHHGLKAFKGNFHDYLRNLPGGGGPPEKEWKFEPRT